MIQVISIITDRPASRKTCEETVARLIGQGRHPELVESKSKSGERFIKVVDHSKPIYDTWRDRDKIIGFEC